MQGNQCIHDEKYSHYLQEKIEMKVHEIYSTNTNVTIRVKTLQLGPIYSQSTKFPCDAGRIVGRYVEDVKFECKYQLHICNQVIPSYIPSI